MDYRFNAAMYRSFLTGQPVRVLRGSKPSGCAGSRPQCCCLLAPWRAPLGHGARGMRGTCAARALVL